MYGLSSLSLLQAGSENQDLPFDQYIIWYPNKPLWSGRKLQISLGVHELSFGFPTAYILFPKDDPVTKIESSTYLRQGERVLCDLKFTFVSGKQRRLFWNHYPNQEILPGPEFKLDLVAGERLTGCNLFYASGGQQNLQAETDLREIQLKRFIDLYVSIDILHMS